MIINQASIKLLRKMHEAPNSECELPLVDFSFLVAEPLG
jgi:hypothetical protein